MIRESLSAEVSLSKLNMNYRSCSWNRWVRLCQAAQHTDMPQLRHHHSDDIMRTNARRMTKTSPGLTFHPAAEMKPIRVSTCLCPFHVICICKPGSPIAPQLHGEKQPICQSGAIEEQIGEPVSSDPALPDTLPWEKQHGPIAGCAASPLTRRTSSTSAALCPTVLAGFTAEQRKSRTVRSILGRYVPSLILNLTSVITPSYDHLLLHVCEPEHWSDFYL